jgi:hypothetical protein
VTTSATQPSSTSVIARASPQNSWSRTEHGCTASSSEISGVANRA